MQAVVCRLLGGSGRKPLALVPVKKIPALCAPARSGPGTEIPRRCALPLAA
jgi:hypothetical protein